MKNFRFMPAKVAVGGFLAALAIVFAGDSLAATDALSFSYGNSSAQTVGMLTLDDELQRDGSVHSRQRHADDFSVPRVKHIPAYPETNEERLIRVSYRLSAASAGRCERPVMLTGMTLHDIAAYSGKGRNAAEHELHLGMGFGIRLIVPDSVAANAGLQAGDVIVNLNGRDLGAFGTSLIRRSASYARTAEFELLLETELRRGPAQLVVIRGGSLITIALQADHGCGGKPVFYYDGGVNAWADGTYVAVTSKMIDFAQTDEELAFVIAHEMAHNILRHGEKLKGRSMLLASLGVGSKKIKGAEIEADILGTKILASAGYSTNGALALLNRSRPMQAMSLSLTHPSISKRMSLVQATASDASLAASEPITAASDIDAAPGVGVLASISVQTPFELQVHGIGQQPGNSLRDLGKIDWMAPKLAPWWQLQSADIQVKRADWAGLRQGDVNAVEISRTTVCMGAGLPDCSPENT